REMFDDINALVGAVAKAHDTSDMDVITASEEGSLAMEMMTDAEGRNFIAVDHDGKAVRVYPGAIYRQGDAPEAVDEEDCGTGGCSCGH
ncbi:MAG: hypothetical protein H7Z12_12960, partial [Rhodospirillaceae bacterium]|nr:hypothetical protein [Rhodospirillales bacterium]